MAAEAPLAPKLGSEHLAEALRRRREGCREFESNPGKSTADATAGGALSSQGPRPLMFESVPGQSTADARSANLCESASGGNPEVRGAPPAFLGTPPPLRGEAAGWSSGRTRETVSSGTPFDELQTTPPRSGLRTDRDLREWMDKARGECAVLESVQQESCADASGHPEQEDAGPPREQFSPPPRERAQQTDSQHAWQELRGSTAGGGAGDTAVRDRAWGGALAEQMLAGTGPRLPIALSRLLLGGSSEQRNRNGRPVFDMTMFDSDGDESPVRAGSGAVDEEYLEPALGDSRLADAFGSKFTPWLAQDPGEVEADKTSPPAVFKVISQLLRYHCPSAAWAVENCSIQPDASAAGQGSAGGQELATALAFAMCDGEGNLSKKAPQALCEAVFGGVNRASLLRFCDCLVGEGEPALLLFAVVLLLAELVPEPGEDLEHLGARLRGKEGLGAIGAHGPESVARCVQGAKALFDATPLSVLEPVMRSAVGATALSASRCRPMPSMCMVSPAELLQHTFETPARSWRLVVVDVRMRPAGSALPVSVRLRPAMHAQRKRVLSEIPHQEQIHLCLMGDGPPGPGEDAYQLCRYLFGPAVRRRHVSVVDGGWPAVEELANSMQLEMMPVSADDCAPYLEASDVERSPSSSSSVGQAADKVLLRVEEATDAFGDHVASATGTASAVSMKVAKNVGKAGLVAFRMLGGLMQHGSPSKTEGEGARRAGVGEAEARAQEPCAGSREGGAASSPPGSAKCGRHYDLPDPFLL